MTTTWGEDYVTLALRVEKHFEGFVDAYCGPPELKTRTEKEEKQSLDQLLAQAEHLEATVPAEDKARRIYLEKQITGIKTTISVLRGEEMDYTRKVELFFDITPEKTPDSHLDRQIQILKDIFKTDRIHEAVDEWRTSREVSESRLESMIQELCAEGRKRTYDLYPLPENEHIDFVLVHDKPWSGYNWYLGAYLSRVEINTDIPVQIAGLPSLIFHEGYPGHHTDHVIKEKILYNEKGFLEASIFVYNTPECLISEGVGNAGLNLIFEDRKKVYEYLNAKFQANLDVETEAAIAEAFKTLSRSSGNAALMVHQEDCPPEEAVEYLVQMGLTTQKRAEKQMEFITNPLFSPYIFNYTVGEDIVQEAYKSINPRTIYESQVCPSNLRYLQ
ncbi:MAG: hypothetical protein HXS52_01460 [Theionarchaea archaeon]|nr:hypothetical protein [Theionarchaea archaeon]MBU7036570.1 hypothetical protein [Theionarchaea archaeon]